jgi:predicted RNA-binding protein associated with RNAse of E/G family
MQIAKRSGEQTNLTVIASVLLQLSLHATGSPPYCELCGADLIVRKQSWWWLLLAAFIPAVLNMVSNGWLFVLPPTCGRSRC